MNVPKAITTPWRRIAAVDLQDPEDLSRLSAAAAETACVASACATAVTLGKCGESCVSVMTSTACATRENSARVRPHELQ